MGCTGIGGYNLTGMNFSQGAHEKDKCNILQHLLFSNFNKNNKNNSYNINNNNNNNDNNNKVQYNKNNDINNNTHENNNKLDLESAKETFVQTCRVVIWKIYNTYYYTYNYIL